MFGATALSGFFSLSAYALRGARRAPKSNGENHLSVHQRYEKIESQLAPLQLTASLCRAVCNLILAAVMVYLFLPDDGSWDWLAATGALATAAALIAVFGIAIPSAWARYSANQIVLVVYGPLLALRYVLFPIIFFMQSLELPIRRLTGVEAETPSEQVRQEILQAATDGAAEGSVEHEEVQMIASVIEFADREAGEIMTPRTEVFALPVETTWAHACVAIYSAGHTRVPVYQADMDNIIGVLYAKDLLQHIEGPPPTDLRTIMRKAFFVPETKPLRDLLREFKTRKVHLAVVLDEYGGTAGVISIEDVLEEIVGEISDEYDRSEPALMHRIDAENTEVDGRMYIDDLNEAMGLHIPEDQDYVTVAGMVFSELGYIPQAGETLDAHGGRFTVLTADERKITKLKVEKLPEEDPEEERE